MGEANTQAKEDHKTSKIEGKSAKARATVMTKKAPVVQLLDAVAAKAEKEGLKETLLARKSPRCHRQQEKLTRYAEGFTREPRLVASGEEGIARSLRSEVSPARARSPLGSTIALR